MKYFNIITILLIFSGCSSTPAPIVTNTIKHDTTKIGIAWNMQNGNLDTAYVSNGSVVDVHGNFDNQTNTAYLQIRSIKDITTQEVVMPKEAESFLDKFINVLITILVIAIGIGTFILIRMKKKQEVKH